ncbi:MAG: hypothetical protein ABJX35_01695 [Hyphomicrobiales bacterium]
MTTAKKAKDKRTLEANISRSGQHISIQWIDRDAGGQVWEDYLVPLRPVLKCGEDLRGLLTDLEQCDWTASGEPDRLYCLRQLAKCGARLYDLLLTGTESRESSQFAATQFRTWFEKTVCTNVDEWRIQVIHQQYDTLVLPWGLVFSPPTNSDADIDQLSDKFEDYKNFWAHSYGLAVRGTRGLESEKTQTVPKASDSRITITIEAGREVIEFAKREKPALTDHFFESQVAGNMDQLVDVSQTYDEMNIFWYMHLRAEDGRLMLDEEPLEALELSDVTKRRQYVLLLMLDGDSVLSSNGGIGWLRHTLIHGRSGLIAAETDITNPQLSLFGWTFMKRIMQEKNKWLADTIADAREEFWPRSLLLGVYCDPLHIEFNPPLENEIAQADQFLSSMKTYFYAKG